MRLKELKKLGNEELIKSKVEDATIKTNILLQFILNMDKTQIRINDDIEINRKQEKTFWTYIGEILKGKPIQYIINRQEFMRLDFYVDENVLIPQPDTEILVEEAINIIENLIKKGNSIVERINSSKANNVVNDNKEESIKKRPIKILDLCTGSGAIAIAIENYILTNTNKEEKKDDSQSNDVEIKSCNYENVIEVSASDISKKAIEIAKKNAISINKNTNINFILSDMFDKINDTDFDIIVSNPPYIEAGMILKLSKEVQNEPHIALDGGKDGLDFYRIIAKEAKRHIKKNGHILLEIGYNQRKNVIDIFNNEKYSNIECKRDLSGNDRVIKCRFTACPQSDKGRKQCLFQQM